jgi:hypothetical protein
MEAVVVAVLVATFVAVAVVAGLAVRRIWSATEAPPSRPSQRES